VDARRIAGEFASHWWGTWVVTLDARTLFHLRVVDGTRTIAVAAHPSMLSTYVEHIGTWCEAPATCRIAATTDRQDTGVRWLTLMARCPVCVPKLVERVVEHELSGLPEGAPGELAMTPTKDLRGRATRIGGSTVMSASATARQRLAGHAPGSPPSRTPAAAPPAPVAAVAPPEPTTAPGITPSRLVAPPRPPDAVPDADAPKQPAQPAEPAAEATSPETRPIPRPPVR
jgi:hypothetical protein